MELEALRHEIDLIDDDILNLLLKRKSKCAEIAECKDKMGLPVYCPEREDYILDRVSDRLHCGNEKNGFHLLYEIIMSVNRFNEYTKKPKEFEGHTELGGISVRAVIIDAPGALCRYISPLAAADIEICDIRSQSLPGGKLMVEMELAGDTKSCELLAAVSVLSDSALSFQLL